MKSQEQVYIFLYSLSTKTFDTTLTSSMNLTCLQLRARTNTDRNLNLFAIKLTPKQVDTVNKKIKSNVITEEDIFNSLHYCINIGF
jgi:hypothetical protein